MQGKCFGIFIYFAKYISNVRMRLGSCKKGVLKSYQFNKLMND